MNVRAKMICTGKLTDVDGNHQVHLQAVYVGSEENKSFAKYTPNANVRVTISEGTDAAKLFNEGQEYYVDFSAVVAPPAYVGHPGEMHRNLTEQEKDKHLDTQEEGQIDQ